MCFASHMDRYLIIYIQLFRQRLSNKSVKPYVAMPIGIMGSKSLAFLPPRWNTFNNQAAIKTTLTHNNFRHCRVSCSPFVTQPFSKQLYHLKPNGSVWFGFMNTQILAYYRSLYFRNKSQVNTGCHYFFDSNLNLFIQGEQNIFIPDMQLLCVRLKQSLVENSLF